MASARFAIAPPRLVEMPAKAASKRTPDLAAEGLAALFARTYLTWDAARPEAHRRALEALTGSALGSEAGMRMPEEGSQRVVWEQVVQERQPQAGEHVYTVAAGIEAGAAAADTDTSAVAADASASAVAADANERGVVYLSVSVVRRADGRLSLAGYPAFVGAPASGGADLSSLEGAEVTDSALRTIVRRALSNYLTPAPSELAADLAPGAQVSPPAVGLTLEAIQGIVWAPGGGAVIAVARAAGGGAAYTLAYEIDVLRVRGRWEILAIQMDPDE